MSADRAILLVWGLCVGTAGLAEEAPDGEALREVEFIEYLGMWEGSDDEWVMLDDDEDIEEEPETEPETEDES